MIQALKAVSSGQCGVTIVNTYYLARLLDDQLVILKFLGEPNDEESI